MGFVSLCNRRSRPAGLTGPRSVAGRRMVRRSARGRKRVGMCRCRKVAASEEAAVAQKLKALKELMPSSRWRNGRGQAADGDESSAGDRLFEEAASYIILLKARVDVLQKLVDLYGSGQERTSLSLS